ncbi:UDP-N-acetylmuramoyl-tripeptide--D-alanyl-D-alanine ligase, partial [Thioclava sp. BHET1]
SGQGRTHAAEASYNNHWGVPLTLARMPADSDFAVIEIGMNHPGEIAPLARLARPHVAMITTIAAAHLEAFDGLPAIAREKGSIFEGLEPGGQAVINADLATTPILVAAAEAAGARIWRFGRAAGAEFRLLSSRVAQETTIVQAEAGDLPLLVKIQSAGGHFALNGLGVLAVAATLGLDMGLAVTDLGQWKPPLGRGARERIQMDVVHEDMA